MVSFRAWSHSPKPKPCPRCGGVRRARFLQAVGGANAGLRAGRSLAGQWAFRRGGQARSLPAVGGAGVLAVRRDRHPSARRRGFAAGRLARRLPIGAAEVRTRPAKCPGGSASVSSRSRLAESPGYAAQLSGQAMCPGQVSRPNAPGYVSGPSGATIPPADLGGRASREKKAALTDSPPISFSCSQWPRRRRLPALSATPPQGGRVGTAGRPPSSPHHWRPGPKAP